MYIHILDLRHEASMQSERGRQRRGRTSCSTSIFFANRIVRAVVGAFVCTQSSQPRVPQERPRATPELPRAPKSRPRAPRATPKRPKRAPRAPKSTPERPKNAQEHPKDAPRAPQERQIEAARAPWSAQEHQIEAPRATFTKHCPCAAKSMKTLPLRSKIDAQRRLGQPNRGNQGTKSRSRRVDRASQGAQSSPIEPIEARSSQPGRARSLGCSPS